MALAMKEKREGNYQETRAREASLIPFKTVNHKDAIWYISSRHQRRDPVSTKRYVNNVVSIRREEVKPPHFFEPSVTPRANDMTA
jgi:hypothetical protein